MARSTGKRRSAALFQQLEQLADAPAPACAAEDIALDWAELDRQPIVNVPDTSRSPRMKKFRMQLLHHWLTHNFDPCRALDVGGGKGLLAYLLAQDGWQTAVVDPFDQSLPDKYKDITAERRVKIDPAATVRRITAPFETEMGAEADLLIGMHAHGSNARIIDAAARYGCGFVLFPCCVIDEPFYPRLGVHWLQALADYARRQNLDFTPFRLNFKGQNIGIVHRPERLRVPVSGSERFPPL